MKRLLAIFMALTLSMLFGACGSTDKEETTTEQYAAVSQSSSGIDIDLLNMSSTMIYSEVSQIMADPTAYIGKTIRAKGTFRENMGYYFVLINDATACCAQGIEFIWEGEHAFPADYPDEDTEIIVTGTFEDYMEGDAKYYHIDNASLETA